MKNKSTALRILIATLAFLIICLYAAGLVFMMTKRSDIGINLWVISTVLGALFLYIKMKRDKKARDLEEVEKEEAEYQARLKKEQENN